MSAHARPALSQPRWPILCLAALLGISTLLHIHVVRRDSVPEVADGSGYYRTSLTLYRMLRSGQTEQAARYLTHPGIRPPLPQLVTLALFWITDDSSQTMARHSILVFFWILVCCTYALGASLQDRLTGLVAATLVACFPQVIGFSRIYWMDLPLAAMTSLSLWALLHTHAFSRRWPSALFGITVGLGLLTKYTFVVFVAGPALYGLAQGLHRKRPRPLLTNLTLVVMSTLFIAGYWYARMLPHAWQNVLFNLGSGVLTARPWLSMDNLLLYPGYLYHQMGPLAFIALLVALPLFLRHGKRRTRSFLLTWLALPYLFFTFFLLGIEWSRFTLPCLPAAALLTALGLLQLRFHPIQQAFAACLSLCSLLLMLRLSFTAPQQLSRGQFPWKRARFNGLLAPQSFDFHLPVLDRTPAVSQNRTTHLAVLPDLGNLASLLETRALHQRANLMFSIPYEPESTDFDEFSFPARVGQPEYLRRFDYLLKVDPPPGMHVPVRRPQDYLLTEEIWKAVQQDFSELHRLRLPNGAVMRVYRNRGAVNG